MFCVDNLTTYESQDVNNYSCSLQRKKRGGGIPVIFDHSTSPILSPKLTFSSPFHSRRVLSIIKGTCGTNPCKSPVLSVLYLQATQQTEILHLHA